MGLVWGDLFDKNDGYAKFNKIEIKESQQGGKLKKYAAEKVLEYNRGYQKNFKKTKIEQRFIFISHCLKPALIKKIVKLARKLGYQKEHILIVGGFTTVAETLKQFGHPPFIGIACPREITQGAGALNDFCAQAVALSVFKCPIIRIGEPARGKSEVDLGEVEKILRLSQPTLKSR